MPASRSAKGWSISKSWAITPPTETACDAAYIVRCVHSNESIHDLIVEFEAPSAVASIGYAEEIARRFLRTGDPPRHVIVDTQGDARVLDETMGG
jgi:hypothetical protein